MPQCRIQPRTWYVEFGLDVSAAPAFAVDGFELEQPTALPPSDSKIRLCIKDVMPGQLKSRRTTNSTTKKNQPLKKILGNGLDLPLLQLSLVRPHQSYRLATRIDRNVVHLDLTCPLRL